MAEPWGNLLIHGSPDGQCPGPHRSRGGGPVGVPPGPPRSSRPAPIVGESTVLGRGVHPTAQTVREVASMTTSDDMPVLPHVTAADTVDEIVAKSKRKKDFPLRREFLQQTHDGEPSPGPLSLLVTAGDDRGLYLYLLLVTKASAEPWDAALPSAVWARAIGVPLPATKTARSSISKAWLRLERRGLVRRVRKARLADVQLLREDGQGGEYWNPGETGDPYFRVPLALWLQGPDDRTRWYQVLNLPELAILLIGRSLGDRFLLPQEKSKAWYGLSADTVGRGVAGLERKGLLRVEKRYKKAPLSAVGYTAENRYTLLAPFGPVGYASGTGGATGKPQKAPTGEPTRTASKTVSTNPTKKLRKRMKPAS